MELMEFVHNMEHDYPLTDVIRDGWNRVVKGAKTYNGLYFGLVTLLLMNDYGVARSAMQGADKEQTDELDKRIQFLLVNVNNLRDTDLEVDAPIMDEYHDLFDQVILLVKEYDLDGGRWRRNGRLLSDDWETLMMYDNRVLHGIKPYESMYQALWIMMQLRTYMVALMPPVEVAV